MAEQQQQQTASAPLLGSEINHTPDAYGHHVHVDDDGHDAEYYELEDNVADGCWAHRLQRACARALASRRKHFAVMAVVALDVSTLLVNIFIQLIACETQQADEPWVKTVTKALEAVGLLFSSLFMVELVACLYAFGWRYLSSKFHLFDAAVIVLGFLIDVGLHGLAESIGSLVVVLRLWRLAKISEEVVLGATERMEMLEHHIDELEAENKHLRGMISKSQQNSRDPRQRQASMY
ncbi:hypothetical protein PWT90_07116 [Aphanocladium album]|nr:hypothetical protein PWT90_07116 [Aphanocladium album]